MVFLRQQPEFMLKFLDLYRSHEHLWKPTNKDYKDKLKRTIALTAIRDQLGVADITVEDVRTKIKTIRTMYKKELTKVLKSQKVAKTSEDQYVSTLWWFKAAHAFLKDLTDPNTIDNSVSEITIDENELVETSNSYTEMDFNVQEDQRLPFSNGIVFSRTDNISDFSDEDGAGGATENIQITVIKWSPNDILTLIELYRQNELLWNTRHKNYWNKHARFEAIKSIITKLEIPNLKIEDVKSKIKVIRTTYRRELHLIHKHSEFSEMKYTPRLFWFKAADAFLRGVSSSCSSKLSCSSELNSSTQVDAIKEENDSDLEEDPLWTVDSQDNETWTHDPETEEEPTYTTLESRKRKLSSSESFQISGNGSKEKIRKDNEEEFDNGEFDVFGKLVALQLKQMPAYYAVLCQDKIHAILRDQRIELLRNSLPSSSNDFNSDGIGDR